MWTQKHSQRQYFEQQKSLPVVYSRSYGPERHWNLYRPKYGVWNNDYGIMSGLWDDILPIYHRGRQLASSAIKRGTISRPISRLSTPRRNFRYHALATAKKPGCGPNCKKPRCAATDPQYSKPSGAADKPKRRKGAKKAGIGPPTATVTNTDANMTDVQDKIFNNENYDITMGLKNLKEVNESNDLKVFPVVEQICERNCSECSGVTRERNEEATETPDNRNDSQDTGLTTSRSVAINTEGASREVPVIRVLKDVNSNLIPVTPERTHKQTSPIPRLKMPTPLPRVALLRPPKQKPPPTLTKVEKVMRRSVVEYGEVLATLRQKPVTPLHSQPISPVSLTSRRTMPGKTHPRTQKLVPGKLAPRLFTPPAPQALTNSPQDQTPSPQSQPIRREQTLNPNTIKTSIPQDNPHQSSTTSSIIITTTSSNFELNSSTTEEEASTNDSTPATAMYCLCSLCGKSKRVTDASQPNSAAVYRNNPLYSPPESLRTQSDPHMPKNEHADSVTSGNRAGLYTFLEILVLVVVGGILTLGLIPSMESVFRAFVADYCRCFSTGKGNTSKTGTGGRPFTGDGMEGGVVKWVTCLLDANRATLTPVR